MLIILCFGLLLSPRIECAALKAGANHRVSIAYLDITIRELEGTLHVGSSAPAFLSSSMYVTGENDREQHVNYNLYVDTSRVGIRWPNPARNGKWRFVHREQR